MKTMEVKPDDIDQDFPMILQVENYLETELKTINDRETSITEQNGPLLKEELKSMCSINENLNATSNEENTLLAYQSKKTNTSISSTCNNLLLIEILNSTATATKKNEIQKRDALSLEQRIEVIKARESGLSYKQLAKRFECGRSQIYGILRRKDDWLKEWEDNKNKGMKRKRTPTFDELSRLTFEWFQNAQKQGVVVNGKIVQMKALEIAQVLNITNFNASNGWLNSFRKRYNISFPNCPKKIADSGLVDNNYKNILPSSVWEFEPKHVYTMCETGLLFRSLPAQTLADKVKLSNEGELAEDRFTIGLCCNAAGEKEDILVVGTSTNLQCTQALERLNVIWKANGKSQITLEILTDWIKTFNDKMRIQKRRVLLLLEFPPFSLDLSNVQLEFLPADVPTRILHQGVIQQFRMLYTWKMIRTLIERSSSQLNLNESARGISALDAITWLNESWLEVSVILVKKCFGGMNQDMNESTTKCNENKILEKKLRFMCKAINIDEPVLNYDIACWDLNVETASKVENNDCSSNEANVATMSTLALKQCFNNDSFSNEESVSTMSTPAMKQCFNNDPFSNEESVSTISTPAMKQCINNGGFSTEENASVSEAFSLREALVSIGKLKATLEKYDPSKKRSRAHESLVVLKQEVEEIIVENGLRKCPATNLADYLLEYLS